jgi:nucleoside-diphosphate-sugar epimerase
MAEKFLITGGQGSIGSWIARFLLEEGVPFALCDRMPQNSVLSRVIEPERLPALERVFINLSDPSSIGRVLFERGITRAIHLAAFEEPDSRKHLDRSLFEAVRASGGQVSMIAYAAGPGDESGEEARRFFAEAEVPSVGLRLGTVYGVGREGAPDGAATLAIKAAVLARSFALPPCGNSGFTYVEDAARGFIQAALSIERAALTFRIAPEAVPVEDFVREIERAVPEASGLIRASGEPTPVSLEIEEADLPGFVPERLFTTTPIAEGIRRTAEFFRALAAGGRLQN